MYLKMKVRAVSFNCIARLKDIKCHETKLLLHIREYSKSLVGA